MAIEIKLNKPAMEQDGIYYCELIFTMRKYMPNGSEKELLLYQDKIVYSPYNNKEIDKIISTNFGIKQTTSKQVITGNFTIIKYLERLIKTHLRDG